MVRPTPIPWLLAVDMDRTDRGNQPDDPAGPDDQGKPPRPDVGAAFDLWLQRGLHQLYDGVAAEPIPEDLLRLIEDDRARRKG